MRALIWIGTVLLWLVLITASSIGLVLLMPHRDPVAGAVGTAALTLVWINVVTTGSVAYWFDSTESESARRARRPTRIVSAVLLVLAAAILIGLVVVTGLAAWFVAVVLALAVALQFAAVPIARRLGVPARRRDADRPWSPIDLGKLHRGRRRALVVGLAVTIAAAAILAVVTATVGSSGHHPERLALQFGLLAIDFGLLAAGITLMISTLGMSAQLRSLLGGDLGRARRIAKVVLRGRGSLEPGEERAAARYAQVIPAHQENSIAGIVLLEAGAALGLIANGIHGFGPSIWIAAVGGAILIAVVVIAALRMPRARRYAREHAAEAELPDPSTASAPAPTAAPAQPSPSSAD